MNDIYVIFDSSPGPETGKFVEVENGEGKGLSLVGTGSEWKKREDGYWTLGPFCTESSIDVIEGSLQSAFVEGRKSAFQSDTDLEINDGLGI